MAAPRVYRLPTQTVLHRAVTRGVPAFRSAAAQAERDIPKFVERELNGYLQCGQFEHGFAQVSCRACSHTYRVGFSCKGRGICPSCAGRRMADVSCHLVDRVLPPAPYRQWVMTMPPPLRYMLAYDTPLLSATLQSFVGEIFRWQRHQAKMRYDLRSVKAAITGCVTVVQRFGSALDLNLCAYYLALLPPRFHVKSSC